jgi:spermidine synthase
MATQPRDGNEPRADQPGTDGRVELLADLDQPGSWMLLVDGISQSHVDLDDPRHLDLEYMQRLAHLIDLAAPAGTPLRVLHLGAGGLTLARYVAATRRGSRQLAVEADAEVARLVRQRLPVACAEPGTRRIGVRLGDARAVLEQLPAGSFDVVVADVFAGDRTPAHLTSVEFTRAAARALAPAGVYAVNVGDGPPLAHARGRTAAVRAVFPHVCVIAEPAVLRSRRFGNLVIVGSGRELPLAGLTRRLAADPFPARLVAGAELDQFTTGAPPIVDARAEPSPPIPPEVLS